MFQYVINQFRCSLWHKNLQIVKTVMDDQCPMSIFRLNDVDHGHGNNDTDVAHTTQWSCQRTFAKFRSAQSPTRPSTCWKYPPVSQFHIYFLVGAFSVNCTKSWRLVGSSNTQADAGASIFKVHITNTLWCTHPKLMQADTHLQSTIYNPNCDELRRIKTNSKTASVP